MPVPGDHRNRRRGQCLDIGPAGQPLVGRDAHQKLPVAVVARLRGIRRRAIALRAAQQDRLDRGDTHGVLLSS